jgi:hypothetical protein
MATGNPLPVLVCHTLHPLVSFVPSHNDSGPGLAQIIRMYLQIRSVAATVLNSQARTADKKWSSGLALKGRTITQHRQTVFDEVLKNGAEFTITWEGNSMSKMYAGRTVK